MSDKKEKQPNETKGGSWSSTSLQFLDFFVHEGRTVRGDEPDRQEFYDAVEVLENEAIEENRRSLNSAVSKEDPYWKTWVSTEPSQIDIYLALEDPTTVTVIDEVTECEVVVPMEKVKDLIKVLRSALITMNWYERASGISEDYENGKQQMMVDLKLDSEMVKPVDKFLLMDSLYKCYLSLDNTLKLDCAHMDTIKNEIRPQLGYLSNKDMAQLIQMKTSGRELTNVVYITKEKKTGRPFPFFPRIALAEMIVNFICVRLNKYIKVDSMTWTEEQKMIIVHKNIILTPSKIDRFISLIEKSNDLSFYIKCTAISDLRNAKMKLASIDDEAYEQFERDCQVFYDRLVKHSTDRRFLRLVWSEVLKSCAEQGKNYNDCTINIIKLLEEKDKDFFAKDSKAYKEKICNLMTSIVYHSYILQGKDFPYKVGVEQRLQLELMVRLFTEDEARVRGLVVMAGPTDLDINYLHLSLSIDSKGPDQGGRETFKTESKGGFWRCPGLFWFLLMCLVTTCSANCVSEPNSTFSVPSYQYIGNFSLNEAHDTVDFDDGFLPFCWNKATNLSTRFCEAMCINITNGSLPRLMNGCDGDEYACENANCSTNSPCYCRFGTIRQKIESAPGFEQVFCEGTSLRNPVFTQVLTLESLRTITNNSSVSKKRSVGSDGIFITREHRNLEVRTNEIGQCYFVMMTKDDKSEIKEFCGQYYISVIDDSYFIKEGYLKVGVVNKLGNGTKTSEFYLYAVVSCLRDTAYWWLFDFGSWKCLNDYEKFFFVFLFVVLVYFSICLLYRLAWLLMLFFYLVKLPMVMMRRAGKSVSESNTYNKAKNYVAEVANEIKGEKEEIVQIPKKENPVGEMRYRWQNGKLVSYMMIVGLIACCSACDVVVPIGSEFPVCSNSGTELICSVSVAAQITIPAVGMKACLSVNRSGTILGNIEIEYRNMRNDLTLSTEYYTSNWRHNQESARNCPGSGLCPIDGVCPVSPTTNKFNYYFPSNNIQSYPGEWGCRNACACAGCGCFYCTSSCVFWAYSIIPRNEIFEIKSISSSRLTPRVTVSGFNGEGNLQLTNNFQNLDNIEYKVIGSLVGDTTVFGNNKVKVGSSQAFVAASPRNSPLPDIVGDIQASSVIDLQNPGISGFIYSRSMVDVRDVGYGQTFTYSRPGIDTNGFALNELRLPTMFGGNLWRYDESGLYSELTNPGPIVLQVLSSAPITFSTTVNLVCPNVVVLSSSGCFSCSTGISIVIRGMSSCLTGSCSVSSTGSISLATTVLQLTTTQTNYSIFGYTNTAQNSGTIVVTCNGGTSSSQYSFNAVQVISLNNTGSNSSTSNSNNDIGAVVGSFLSSSLSFTGMWWESLLTYGVIVAIVLLMVFLFPWLLGRISSSWNEMKNRKMKKI